MFLEKFIPGINLHPCFMEILWALTVKLISNISLPIFLNPNIAFQFVSVFAAIFICSIQHFKIRRDFSFSLVGVLGTEYALAGFQAALKLIWTIPYCLLTFLLRGHQLVLLHSTI